MRQRTQDFWDEQVHQTEFTSRLSGKEIGQAIASLVDERTAKSLKDHYNTKFEHTAGGKRRSRSMGDVWVEFDGVFYPINVKTGILVEGENKTGQPNMVAMSKLLKALIGCKIDAYYLMVIRFSTPTNVLHDTTASVYFVDMSDYLDCMTFDAGPDQIMMKPGAFFAAISNGERSSTSTSDKIATLLKMYESGIKRLFKNRQKTVSALGKAHDTYQQQETTILNQSSFNLLP